MATIRSLPALRRRFMGRIRDESDRHRRASAIVFAPHQDDETLGCGGTILQKRDAGTAVACVFMTDGRTSHSRFMPEAELRETRMAEAMAAAEVLGISRGDVHFLDFEDGKLGRHRTAAIDAVVPLIVALRPAEVFTPYRHDGTPDHDETAAVVLEACRRSGLALRICEYPIWCWNQWPWVSIEAGLDRETMRSLLRTLRAGCGLQLFRDFTSGVNVASQLDRKWLALNCHRSQMTILRPGTAWPTLADVAAGEFLECFFQDFEVFRCTELGPA